MTIRSSKRGPETRTDFDDKRASHRLRNMYITLLTWLYAVSGSIYTIHSGFQAVYRDSSFLVSLFAGLAPMVLIMLVIHKAFRVILLGRL